jgi:uncharacterized repeat protein (TIGR01451 family)
MFGDSWRQWLHRTFHTFPRRTGGRGSQRSQRAWLAVEILENRATPTVVNLTPLADNTLYQVSTADPSQQLSNGAGQFFYVGRTNQGSNDIRRGAIKFDLSGVPAGSAINSVTLTLQMSKTRNGAQMVALNRALMNWGEGTSNAAMAGRQGGEGTQATTGDVTWFYTFFSTQKWTTPGGDFVSTPSASTSVNGVGKYQWTGTGLIADVQQWLSNPAGNFGWILTGNETTGDTSKEFDTKENTSAAARPMLTIDFTPPTVSLPDLTISKSHTGDFHQGDAADTYTVNVSNVGSGPTVGAVTVTDTLPTGLAPTAADNGTVNGWTVTTNGQAITATRSDALAPGGSYPILSLTVSVANNAPASVINTATVAGGGETNTANDSASDPTRINQLPDLTISKSHTGNFKQGDSADTYTLSVSNIGTGPTAGTVSVTDTLPTGLAPTAADSGVLNGWTITTNGQTITAVRGDVLTSGSSYPALTLTVSVADDAPASVTNTATVAGGGENNTANDTASDVTAITQVADLAISKTHMGTFNPGDAADVYTIVVSNVGAAPTDGSPVTVIDTLPAGLTPTASDSGKINGWSVSFSGQTITATRSDVLNNGASYPTLTITVSVANNIAPVVTNAATVAGGGEVNTANDTASDPTATRPVADLTISKSHTGTFRPGDAMDIYTLTVSNVGAVPTDGTTVTVTDTLPSGLTPTPADNGFINGWTVRTSGQTITATRSDALAPGSSYPVLTVTVSVAANAPASVTNTAAVAGGGEVNTANDTASDPTIINELPDLVISKSHTGNFHPGDRADTYAIVVSNVGAVPTDGTTVTVIDTLPTGLTPTAADNGFINGWTVTTSGQTVTATRSDVLGAGRSYSPLTLTVRVASDAPPSITNTATVAGGGEINTANDTASDVTAITQVADLTIAISHSGNFTAGGSAAYSVTVNNTGGAPTNTPVTLIDMLPAGLIYTGPAAVSGWTISVNGQTLTATRMDVLASGAGFPALTLTVSVASNAPTRFVNTITASGGGEVDFSNSGATDVTGGQSPQRRGGDPTSIPLGTSVAAILDNVANAFTHSDEYWTNLVTQDYLQLLNRTPSAAEVGSWVDLLKAGLTDEQVLAGFTSSAEYFQQAGGSDQTWVDTVYHDVLGRTADAAGEATWLQALASGTSQFNVAFAIATSVEHESIVVAADYQRYLGRSASPAEVASWVNQFQRGLSSEQVAAALVASEEFYADQGATIPGWLNGAYQVLFQRDADAIGFNYWDTYLQNLLA